MMLKGAIISSTATYPARYFAEVTGTYNGDPKFFRAECGWRQSAMAAKRYMDLMLCCGKHQIEWDENLYDINGHVIGSITFKEGRCKITRV